MLPTLMTLYRYMRIIFIMLYFMYINIRIIEDEIENL